jgi:hypothetical protein
LALAAAVAPFAAEPGACAEDFGATGTGLVATFLGPGRDPSNGTTSVDWAAAPKPIDMPTANASNAVTRFAVVMN